MHGTTAARRADGVPVEPHDLRDAVLAWSAAHGRSLPGREVRDPWRVLVLEVMSQQTQFDRSLEAAARFCKRFPGPAALAGAPAADAVRAWAGLGYNRRVLALRSAAGRIVELHGGAVPSTLEALRGLPGVGPYTARAVAARAFGIAVMPVDVNVRRVLGRVLGRQPGAGGRPGADAREIQACADAMAAPGGVPGGFHPGDLADAVMDLAVAICRPRRPDCAACPLAAYCGWLASSTAAGHETGSPGSAAAISPPAGRTGKARPDPVPFTATRRWLRGQLLRELRDLPPGSWLAIHGDRGTHSHEAVRETVAVLQSEGFVELDSQGRARLSES